MSDPVFTERTDQRGKLIICTIDGEEGAARVFSAGEDEARERAEAQARQKLAERAGD